MSDLEEIKRKLNVIWGEYDELEKDHKGTKIETERNTQEIEQLRREIKIQEKKISLLQDARDYLSDELELIKQELEDDSDE